MPIILPYSPHFAEVEVANQSITGATTLAWTSFFTDNLGFFQTNTNTPGDTDVVVQSNIPGLYIASCVLHYSGTTWSGSLGYSGFGIIIGGGEIEALPAGPTPGTQSARLVLWGGSNGDVFNVSITPVGGGTHTLVSGKMMVMFWPKPVTFTQVY